MKIQVGCKLTLFNWQLTDTASSLQYNLHVFIAGRWNHFNAEIESARISSYTDIHARRIRDFQSGQSRGT